MWRIRTRIVHVENQLLFNNHKHTRTHRSRSHQSDSVGHIIEFLPAKLQFDMYKKGNKIKCIKIVYFILLFSLHYYSLRLSIIIILLYFIRFEQKCIYKVAPRCACEYDWRKTKSKKQNGKQLIGYKHILSMQFVTNFISLDEQRVQRNTSAPHCVTSMPNEFRCE